MNGVLVQPERLLSALVRSDELNSLAGAMESIERLFGKALQATNRERLLCFTEKLNRDMGSGHLLSSPLADELLGKRKVTHPHSSLAS